MKLYLIQAVEDGEVLCTRFAGSQVDGRRAREELVTKFGLSKKYISVSVDEEVVPTDKNGLLVYLNELLSKHDNEEEV